jgi:hypothetical protein
MAKNGMNSMRFIPYIYYIYTDIYIYIGAYGGGERCAQSFGGEA